MKVFCFSFIVYIVLLLTQPCQDAGAMVNNGVAKTTPFSQNDKPYQNDPRSDECSPFCICSCCGLSVAEHSTSLRVTTRIERIALPTIFIEYKNSNTTTYQDSIWQPPKA